MICCGLSYIRNAILVTLILLTLLGMSTNCHLSVVVAATQNRSRHSIFMSGIAAIHPFHLLKYQRYMSMDTTIAVFAIDSLRIRE